MHNGDFSATFLQNTTADRTTLQVFNTNPTVHLSIDVEAQSIKPLYFNLPLPSPSQGEGRGMRVNYHTSRLLGYWPNYLVLYGFHGESGDLQLQAKETWQAIETGNAQAKIDGSTMALRYWITDRPQIIRTNQLNIVMLTQAYAERWWPQPDGLFLCGPDLVLDDGTISETGVFPTWECRNSELGIPPGRVAIRNERHTSAAERMPLSPSGPMN